MNRQIGQVAKAPLAVMCIVFLTMTMTATAISDLPEEFKNLPIFQEENIVYEDVTGLEINEDGTWSERKEKPDKEEQIKRETRIKEVGKKAFAEACKVYESRFSRSFVLAQGGRKAKDGSLYGNNLVGCCFYNSVDEATGKRQPSPYGRPINIRFNRTEAEVWIDDFVGMSYKLMPKEVVIVTRFNQLAFRIPYPFSKHVFKAKTGKTFPSIANMYTEYMNVPNVIPCSNIGDDVLMNRIKGQTFVGYTTNRNIQIALGDGEEVKPEVYTVVKIDDEGFMTICYPALNRDAIVYENYTVGGSLIQSQKENIAFVKNDGYAIELMGDLRGSLYMLSQSSGNINKPVQTKRTATHRKSFGAKTRSRR